MGSNALRLVTKPVIDNLVMEAKEFKTLVCEADHAGTVEAVELIEEQ